MGRASRVLLALRLKSILQVVYEDYVLKSPEIKALTL
mgnify:CR=1 FL=1